MINLHCSASNMLMQTALHKRANYPIGAAQKLYDTLARSTGKNV